MKLRPEVPRSASGSVQSIGPPGLSAHDLVVGSWCQCRQACFSKCQCPTGAQGSVVRIHPPLDVAVGVDGTFPVPNTGNKLKKRIEYNDSMDSILGKNMQVRWVLFPGIGNEPGLNQTRLVRDRDIPKNKIHLHTLQPITYLVPKYSVLCQEI